MKASREVVNMSVLLYIGKIFFLAQKKAQQRGLGMLHQRYFTNNKKINELVVNQILLQQEGSDPDAFLKLLQNQDGSGIKQYVTARLWMFSQKETTAIINFN